MEEVREGREKAREPRLACPVKVSGGSLGYVLIRGGYRKLGKDPKGLTL
jgi:hypothetical protein